MILKFKSSNTGDFIRMHCYNCSILLWITIVNFILYLICKINFIIGMYVWIGENVVYIGSSATCGLRIALKCILCGWEGTTVLILTFCAVFICHYLVKHFSFFVSTNSHTHPRYYYLAFLFCLFVCFWQGLALYYRLA